MSLEKNKEAKSEAPFFRTGYSTAGMAWYVLGTLAILAELYSYFYDPHYILRWGGYVVFGLLLEMLYTLFSTGRPGFRSGSSAVTAAILVMSIPANMPAKAVLFAITAAVVLVRMPSVKSGIPFNPVLIGRLFLMIAFFSPIVNWSLPGIDTDAVTTATPIDLYHSEDFTYSLKSLLSGHIGGSWEDMYTLVPGGPGEVFTPVIILLGLLLFWRGIVAWRTGVAFVAGFALTCALLREPVAFNVFSGAVIFAAVFIAGDPKSTPLNKGAQLAGGIIAGIADALIRKYTYYSEGIVYSFLLLNLLTPTLDRIAFRLRSYRLAHLK